jgi:hypothetical protein
MLAAVCVFFFSFRLLHPFDPLRPLYDAIRAALISLICWRKESENNLDPKAEHYRKFLVLGLQRPREAANERERDGETLTRTKQTDSLRKRLRAARYVRPQYISAE